MATEVKWNSGCWLVAGPFSGHHAPLATGAPAYLTAVPTRLPVRVFVRRWTCSARTDPLTHFAAYQGFRYATQRLLLKSRHLLAYIYMHIYILLSTCQRLLRFARPPLFKPCICGGISNWRCKECLNSCARVTSSYLQASLCHTICCVNDRGLICHVWMAWWMYRSTLCYIVSIPYFPSQCL